MRQITQEATEAFNGNYHFSKSNTKVLVIGDITEMYLFGNKIARKLGNEIYITLANWNTATTRERLSGLASIHLKQGQTYVNGKAVSNNEWILV